MGKNSLKSSLVTLGFTPLGDFEKLKKSLVLVSRLQTRTDENLNHVYRTPCGKYVAACHIDTEEACDRAAWNFFSGEQTWNSLERAEKNES